MHFSFFNKGKIELVVWKKKKTLLHYLLKRMFENDSAFNLWIPIGKILMLIICCQTPVTNQSCFLSQLKTCWRFPQWNKNNRWQVWSRIREEYHYVSLAFPSPSPSSAAAVQRNMPVHITFTTLPDRNCNLTLERSCTMYTVPRGGRTLTDEQRCTCLFSCINASRSLSSSPSPRAACVCTANAHTTLQPTQWSICTLRPSN